jgi:DNA repair protein RadC
MFPDTDLFLVDGTLSSSADGKQYPPLRIRELPSDQKPREKLLAHGLAVLSLPELLSVVLGTGTKKEELSQMTQRIIKDYGEKSLFDERDPQAMALELGIPLHKALQIVAVGELGRRFYQRKGVAATIRTARDVFEYTANMRDLPKEHLRGIYLNSQHKVIHDETISVGTLNSSIIHPREVFRPALEYNAAAVILVHNHPSGDAAPSTADFEVTRQLVAAGKMLGVNLIDHVIVTKEGFESINISYE